MTGSMPVQIYHQLRELVGRGLLTRRRILLQVILILLTILFETIGLSLLIPVLKLIESGAGVVDELAMQSRYWRIMKDTFDIVGLTLNLSSLLLIVFGMICLRQIVRYTAQMSMSHTKQMVERDLALRLFRTTLHSAPLALQDVGTGRFTFMINTLANGAATILRTHAAFLNGVIVCAAYLAISIPLAPIPTVVGILLAGLVMTAMGKFARLARAISSRSVDLRQRFQNHLAERYQNWRLIKLVDSVEPETKALTRWAQRIYNLDIDSIRMSALTDLTVVPVMTGLTLSILYLSVSVLHIQVTQIAVLIMVLIRLEPVVRSFSQQRQAMARFGPQFDRAISDLDEFSKLREQDGGGRELTGVTQEIEFSDVTFSYPGSEKPTLEGISVRIPARQMTAIVGPSGAGKSTIVDMLPRLLRPASGRIRIDGVPIEDFSLSSLRRSIAFVSQKSVLFDMTIAENIRYGRPDMSDEMVADAARLAQADEFITRLPGGYQTQIGEGGVKLSGGQQQRLALARAFASGAPILILDEPTSALDYESEAKIKQVVQGILDRREKTIIVIAHRLSTVAAADTMIVMEQGRIVEAGPPARLDNSGGWYKRMLDMQNTRAGEVQ
ncbi:ABC transporter ATP-binding protein [Ferrovibrio sp.]|uniref:ABC transporter ATP-binding protein n=1 Tax=Ferrovibrio sp. TaxID=1917215 RepID=UPI00311E139E